MTPARIMIVEDERVTAEDLRDILTGMGYSVTAVVSTGPDAVREAERTSPDLVLMDIRIKGDIDGVEAASALRQRFQIPSIYLTAHTDPETLDRARIAEPLGYIVKPFQEAELQATIEMALHKHSVDREARRREGLLSATLSAIGEGVISVDSDGRVTFLNAAAEAWTGFRQQEAVGRKLEDVFRVSGAALLTQVALRDGEMADLGEGRTLPARDGSERPIGGTVAPIRDHNGTLSGAVVAFGSARVVAPAGRPASGEPEPGGFRIVAESAAMQRILHFTRRVAASEATTILLEGESGTGKDVLAKYLHYHSRRQSQPFIPINCAAIPDTLLESELFGYEKGAFTDARAQKKGILELANEGAVFLDEIGEMPLLLQAKMLRVLEEQSFRRLGGVKDIQVDLRVIAATNRSLAQAVQQGRFRVDLYYRLNVIQIVVPPLRERQDDIVPLAEHFVRSFNEKFRRSIRGVSPEAAQALAAHNWPGNVRELRNTIERAMILEESDWVRPASLRIGTGDLPVPQAAEAPASAAVDASALDGLTLEDAERRLIVRALEKSGGNQTKAARLLGISRDALRYKIKKFNFKPSG